MNNVVQSLWIGNQLSKIEILCLKSFVKNGYQFHLYHYEPIVDVPAGVILKDAREILPQSSIFKAHGGYAIFADYFRVKLLQRTNGLWVDMDVVCLRRLDFADTDNLILGYQGENEICNAVMKYSSSSPLAEKLASRCEQPWLHESRETLALFEKIHSINIEDMLSTRGAEYTKLFFHLNASWGAVAGPYGISTAVKELNLSEAIKPVHYFYPVHYNDWWSVFYDISMDINDLKNSYTLHLWGQCLRSYKRFNEDVFQRGSIMEHLWTKYW